MTQNNLNLNQNNKNELKYITVLKALQEIPFGVGKKLLIEFLKGKNTTKIKRTNLNFKNSFGVMIKESMNELNSIIDSLVLNKLCDLKAVNGNQFMKVLSLTSKGEKEIYEPTLYKKKVGHNFKEKVTLISDAERKLFEVFSDFLSIYNDEQKKAIVSNASEILCLAGAGSGKTTVLTKRIEFLVKFRSVKASDILAITFTRKARVEMRERLSKVSGLESVRVETFNSFCEKVLQKYNDLIYDKRVRVLSYRDKILIMNKALSKLKLNMAFAIDEYFTFAQKRGKTPEQLANIFLNDCFFVRDYFKFKNKKIEKESFEVDTIAHEKSVKLVLDISKEIESYMQKNGLRDYADQLLDTIHFFKSDVGKSVIPKFEYILIDEYQDVNSTQIELVDILNSPNIFCVGDPRQSIYGWRGSDIRYILNFDDKYPDCEIITLTKNYRSTKHIVELSNKSIESMGLPDLESGIGGVKNISLLSFKSEKEEFGFIVKKILRTDVPLGEIFVLGRTNKQLNEISKILDKNKIRHVLKNDDGGRGGVSADEIGDGGFDGVILATVHAIKGLEAKKVFVVGCNAVNFPCKGSEHPVIDIVKVEEYDKEEEERRLFYVAISRAKEKLYMTYSGKKPTYFVTSDMVNMIERLENGDERVESGESEFESGDKIIEGDSLVDKVELDSESKKELERRFREWRYDLSSKLGIPPYVIMYDKTLLEIVDRIPQDFEELEDIKGMGPKKVEKYGRTILEILSHSNVNVIDKMKEKSDLKKQLRLKDDMLSDEELLEKYYKIKVMLNKVTAREKELKEKIKKMMIEEKRTGFENSKMEISYKKVNRVSYPKAKIEKFVDSDVLEKVRETKEIEVVSVKLREVNR